MGLATISESHASPLSATGNDLIVNKEVTIPQPDKVLSKEEYVINTYNNETAVNVERYSDVVNILRGFGEGSPKTVTYYHRRDLNGNNHGQSKAIDDELNRVHASYLKIKNFEIRLIGSLQMDHQQDMGVVRYTGEAVTYPGFEPLTGDRFMMEVDTGVTALFEINEMPTRLSVRAMSYYRFQFLMTDYVNGDNQLLETIESAVIGTAYFDKLRYLNEPGALLKEEEVLLMEKFKISRAQMITFYCNKFFEKKIYSTLIRPDKVFDPYVVDFMVKVCSFPEMGGCPEQFLSDAKNIMVSPYRRIFNPSTVPSQCVASGYQIQTQRLGTKSTRMNAMLNRQYLEFTDETSQDTASSYLNGVVLTDTIMKDIVLTYLRDGSIKATSLSSLLGTCYNWDEMGQFYQIPLLIFLTKKSILNLQHVAGVPSIYN